MNKNTKYILTLLVTMLLTMQGYAQFNLLVGYKHTRFPNKILNTWINAKNANLPLNADPVDQFNYTNGLVIGARYSFENIRLEASFANTFRDIRNKIKNENQTTVTNDRYNFKNQIYSLGVETFIDHIGIGTTIDFNQFTSKFLPRTQVNSDLLSKDSYWSSHVYLNLEVSAGSFNSFSIRPFVNIPWTSMNLRATADNLLPNGAVPDQDYSIKMFGYGVTLLLTNGRQPW